LASAIRDGASHRFATGVGWMTPPACSCCGHRVGTARVTRHVEERHRAVGLRIEVDEQRPLAPQRKRRREIDGGRGLPHAPFLIGDGDDHQE
jgi:hypothetical protein